MSNKTHIAYLDSIRGLAALTVISEHFVLAYGLPCENRLCRQILDFSPLHFWWDGAAAVSMFFVLSGLVLSFKYFRFGHQPHLGQFSLMGYVIGRFFRIWLPYCAVVLISAWLYLESIDSPILKTALHPSAWLVETWPKQPLTLMNILRESILLNLPATYVLLPQAWTLNIELELSLLLPIGLLLAKRGTAWLVFFGLLAVSVLDVSIFLLHFLLGLIIARYYSVIAEYLACNPWRRRLVLFSGFFLYSSAGVFQESVSETVLWLSSGLGAGLILLFVSGSAWTQTFLSHPALRQIGKVSYSAYLIHMAVLLCLTPPILKELESLGGNRLWLWFGGWLLTIAIVQLLSLLSYHWLESPSMALGHRIMNAILPKNTVKH